MKRWLLFYLLIHFIPVVKSQAQGGGTFYIPPEQTYSSGSIAAYVQSNFTTDRDKLSAIYSWVTANISYDKDSMYNINWGKEKDEQVVATLRRRKGVCENYATVFTDIAIKSGVPSFVISGYTRKAGYMKKTGHSWSTVLLDNEWLLCDPTWDAGNNGSNNYFLVSPGQFIESHIPFDPLWQLLPHPVSQKEFNSGSWYTKKEAMPLNVADSVMAFLQLDSVQQLQASLLRIKKAGFENDMVKVWHSYVDMKIAIVYGDKDMQLYNETVADLNRATKIFNEFVQYRNNRFMPVRPDAEMNDLLAPAAGILTMANKKLDDIGRVVENFQYDTGNLKSRLSNLKIKVKEQQDFLKKYLESSVADRGRLFYK
jgi:Transglutaminase-like superfamily